MRGLCSSDAFILTVAGSCNSSVSSLFPEDILYISSSFTSDEVILLIFTFAISTVPSSSRAPGGISTVILPSVIVPPFFAEISEVLTSVSVRVDIISGVGVTGTVVGEMVGVEITGTAVLSPPQPEDNAINNRKRTIAK